MKKPLIFVLGILVLVSGCEKKSAGPILARFDGDQITETDFNKKLKGLPTEIRVAAIRRKKEFIEDMAAEHFLLKEAQRRKIEMDPDVKELLKTARKKIIIAKLIETEVDKKLKLGVDEASQYYESHSSEFMTPLLFRASHILVKTQALADKIREEVLAGADFEEVARRVSVDTTAQRGGDLGFFQKGQFVPEFEATVLSMKKGELGPVVKTQFGFHIVKLTDRVEPRLREFRAVKKMVEERLLNEKRASHFKAYLEKLKGKTQIEFDEKAIEAL